MRVAVLSLHTSPLAQPGIGDNGGMNVYVRELVAGLAHRGHECTVYVRASAAGLPPVVHVEPGFDVVNVPAGPPQLDKHELVGTVEAFTARVRRHLRGDRPADVIHANYWLSAMAGHHLKHELALPLVCTFHTLARVKAAAGDPEGEDRAEQEARAIDCSDALLASCDPEARQLEGFYGADPDRIAIVPPGVDHAFFSPGPAHGARAALGFGSNPRLLFVGRIQPLKGLDVAVTALSLLRRRDAVLVVVGGPSGLGGQAELDRVQALARDLGVSHRIHFAAPQPHHRLSTYYRAADVVVVPSRSESFGLVALEAGACGRPVVASAVGGLATLVEDRRTGFLVASRHPVAYANAIDELLSDAALTRDMGEAAAVRAQQYSWSTAAAALEVRFQVSAASALVDCVV